MAGIKEAALRLSLIDGVSGPATGVRGALARLDTHIAEFSRGYAFAKRSFIESAAQLAAFGAALALPIRSAIRFEDALSDFNRVANLSGEQLAATKDQILGLSREVPIAREELAKVGEAIVSAGAPMAELGDRIRLITQASTAWGSSNETTARDLSAVGAALGLTLPQLRDFADVTNFLANTRAAEAPGIVDFVKRVGPLGKLAGLSKEQTAALGTELISMGAASDVAATGLQAVLRAMTKGASATKGQIEAFDKLGLSAERVAQAMQVDAGTALLDVLERLAKLSADERLATANQLFGDEGRSFLGLIDQRERLAKTMEEAADRTKTAGSVETEYQGALKKTSAQLRILRNRLDNVSEAWGSTLLPTIKDASSSLGGFLDRVESIIRMNPGLVRGVTLAAGGLLALRAAGLAGRLGLFLVGKEALVAARALVVAGAAVKGFAVAQLVAGLAAGRRALLGFSAAAAVIGTRGAIGVALAGIGRAALALLSPMRLARAAIVGVGGALRLAFLGSGIGLAIGAVVAAGISIANNWDGLGQLFTSFGAAFMSALGPAKPLVEGIVSAVGSVASKLLGLLGPLDSTGASWRAWGETLGSIAGGGVASLIGAIERVAGAIGRVIELARAGAAAIQNFFSSSGSGASSSGEKNGNAPGSLGTPEGSWKPEPGYKPLPGISGARAMGGPVIAGRSYLIGESGRELFTPSKDGTITPNRVLEAAAAPAGDSVLKTDRVGATPKTAGVSVPGDALQAAAQLQPVSDSLPPPVSPAGANITIHVSAPVTLTVSGASANDAGTIRRAVDAAVSEIGATLHRQLTRQNQVAFSSLRYGDK